MIEFPSIQVPVEDEFDNPAVITDTRELADLLEELPLLNLRGSIKTVLNELSPCNSQRMPAKNRLELLEIYRQTAANLYPSGEDDALARLPITADQREQIRNSIARLFMELAQGYKLLFRQAWNDNNSDLTTVACFRAIEMLGFCMLHSYRRYIDVPPNTLLDMHRIFLYCRLSGISHKPVILDRKHFADKDIALLYRQLLLASISDPYHLPGGAITRLFAMARPLAEVCSLAADDRNIAADQFLVDLDRDQPPTSLKRGLPKDHSKYLLLFDIKDAVFKASLRLDELTDTSSVMEKNEHRLLELMLSKLNIRPARKSERKQASYETFFAAGVDSVHHFLREDTTLLQKSIARAASDHFTRDIDQDDDSVHMLEQWEIVNESLHGMGLQRNHSAHLRPHVGELACLISNKGSVPRFTLVTIQWLRCIRDTVKIGTEIIPGTPHPVTLLSQETGNTEHAIMLNENPALKLPATLIAPRGTFSPDRRFTMHSDNGHGVIIRCHHMIKDTPWFDYFSWGKA